MSKEYEDEVEELMKFAIDDVEGSSVIKCLWYIYIYIWALFESGIPELK